MIPHRDAVVCGANQRDATSAGASPPRPPAAEREECVDAVLGKPEQDIPERSTADRPPHARDERLEAQRSGPRADIEQAARDIDSGQLDTDLHNTPGVERVVREHHAANREDPDRRVANRSADDLADKRNEAGRPGPSRAERKP